MKQVDDLSRSLAAFDQESAMVAVIELSNASWLVAGTLPGIARRPLKKLEPDPTALEQLLARWRLEAETAGRPISRLIVAYEAGRDGFWLARWLRARGVETHVIHPTSVAVSREHRRSKTDRLDSAMLMRVFLGWLRGERGHCSMVAIPTMEEEDAKRPSRERESLVGERTRIINSVKAGLLRLGIRDFNPALRRAAKQLETLVSPEGAALPPNTLDEIRRDLARLAVVRDQIEAIERDRRARLEQAPQSRSNAMVLLLARIVGVGLETADMLVQEILARPLRDRRAVARYAGLTGAPDESGARRREKGLAKSGNARVRRGLIQLAWRFLMFQKGSALAQWYRCRTEAAVPARRKTMIVALARKLLIAFWRLVTTGALPDGIIFRPARGGRQQHRRQLWRRPHLRTSLITIRGGGDTRNAVASMPREECARRLGASHSKRMAASWSWSPADLTEYKVAVRSVAPERELPSDQDLTVLVVPALGGRDHRRLRASISSTTIQRDLVHWPDDGLIPVSRDDGALTGPNLYVIAGLVFVEQVARLGEGRRVVRQIDEIQRDWGFIEPAEVKGVHRHLTASRNMATGRIYQAWAQSKRSGFQPTGTAARPTNAREASRIKKPVPSLGDASEGHKDRTVPRSKTGVP